MREGRWKGKKKGSRRVKRCWREGGEEGGWRECRGESEVEGEGGERNKERERGDT